MSLPHSSQGHQNSSLAVFSRTFFSYGLGQNSSFIPHPYNFSCPAPCWNLKLIFPGPALKPGIIKSAGHWGWPHFWDHCLKEGQAQCQGNRLRGPPSAWEGRAFTGHCLPLGNKGPLSKILEEDGVVVEGGLSQKELIQRHGHVRLSVLLSGKVGNLRG